MAAVAGLALAGGASPAAAAGPAGRRGTLDLGIATYSLRKLPTEAAIAALRHMQVTSASAFRVHLPILAPATPEECRAIAKLFTDAGITLASTGVVTLEKSEAAMRHDFECGRAAGLTTMTASYAKPPDREALLMTERFVREYGIRLAFHNHGPEDAVFPSPYDVWKAVEPYDERMGLCIDVGHSHRAGVDPAEAIRRCSARLYDLHIKDSLAPAGAKRDIPVVMGHGHLDIRGIMTALLDVGYTHQVGLEYEVEELDPVPGVAQSFGYMRGMLAALTTS